MKLNQEVPMTNEQSRRLEILSRLDELERLDTTDWTAKQIEALVQRKKALRAQLNT